MGIEYVRKYPNDPQRIEILRGLSTIEPANDQIGREWCAALKPSNDTEVSYASAKAAFDHGNRSEPIIRLVVERAIAENQGASAIDEVINTYPDGRKTVTHAVFTFVRSHENDPKVIPLLETLKTHKETRPVLLALGAAKLRNGRIPEAIEVFSVIRNPDPLALIMQNYGITATSNMDELQNRIWQEIFSIPPSEETANTFELGCVVYLRSFAMRASHEAIAKFGEMALLKYPSNAELVELTCSALTAIRNPQLKRMWGYAEKLLYGPGARPKFFQMIVEAIVSKQGISDELLLTAATRVSTYFELEPDWPIFGLLEAIAFHRVDPELYETTITETITKITEQITSTNNGTNNGDGTSQHLEELKKIAHRLNASDLLNRIPNIK